MRHTPPPDARDLQRRLPDRLLTALGRHRRGGRRARSVRRTLAVALLVAAGVVATTGAPTGAAHGTPVPVAARDLDTGRTLSPGDVRTVTVPDPPDGALPANPAPTGRVLAGPVRRGEILTDARLVGDRGPRPGPGRAAVPVRPHDTATVGLLEPGMRVALIGVGADGAARTLTDDAIVLSVRAAPSGPTDGALVVVSVPDAVADAVAATAITGTIGVRFA